MPVRVLEQIKLDVCYESLPVIFIGDGAGVVYSTPRHEPSEYGRRGRAARRAGLSILSPADAPEMTAAMELAFAADGPVYLRMGKADLGVVHDDVRDLQWGRMLPGAGGRRAAGLAGDRLDGADGSGGAARMAGQRRLERPVHQAA